MSVAVDTDPGAAPVGAGLVERVGALEVLFERIARTRMRDVPILHPGLAVKAVGFEATDGGAAALGVLVTPWFMNLVWLPLRDRAEDPATPVGVTRMRAVGCECFDFIGANEPGFGPYEACSLFSPMADFGDQAAALATAQEVLRILREPPRDAADEATGQTAHEAAPVAAPATSRRALLFGRAAAADEPR
jgi:[NiFe] hydrogenase assembly HybE family chaperone